MIGALCPQCGAPCSVSLATPDQIACGHCGYAGAPPAQAGREIHAAIGVLTGLSVRRRQLSGLQRRAVTKTWLYSAIFLVVWLLVVIPFAIFALVLLLGPGPGNPYLTASLGIAPLLLVFASGVFGLWWLRRSGRKLLDSCAAVAPLVPGQPARCHVCGAPLTADSSSAVVRCGFCQADNVVTRDVMSRVAARQNVVTNGLEQAVRSSASSFGMQSALVNAFVLGMAFLAPVACFVGAIALLAGLWQLELEADTTVRYVRYSTPAGECLGRIRNEAGSRVLDFRDAPAPGAPAKLSIPAGRKLQELSVTDLVGLEVVGPENHILKVDRVLRTEADRSVNLLRMVDHEGLTRDVEVAGTCFPSGKRIEQVAHRDDLLLPDVHDMASDKGRLLLAGDDLEIVTKADGKIRKVTTTYLTHRVRVAEGAIVTLSRDKEASDDHHYLELRNSPGGNVKDWEKKAVSVRPFTANASHVYYVKGGELYRASWSGGGKERVSADSATVGAATADASGVYWLEYSRAGLLDDKRWSAMVRGTKDEQARKIASGLSVSDRPRLVTAGSRLIWLDAKSQLVGLSVSDGKLKALGKIPGARGIRADARGVYVATGQALNTQHQIVWLPADASDLSGLRVVAPRGGKIEAMVLEPSALYWVDGAYVMKLPR